MLTKRRLFTARNPIPARSHLSSDLSIATYVASVSTNIVFTRTGRMIRGLRVCQNEECRLPQNRDRTGAANIGTQFCRLYEGKPPIRQPTEDDVEFHRLNLALCASCD